MIRLLIAALALALPACATVAPYQPEDNNPVAIAGYGDGYIVFQRGRFHCAEGQHRAIFVVPPLGAWVGCWAQEENLVLVAFENGDRLVIDTTWREEEQPAKRQDGKRGA